MTDPLAGAEAELLRLEAAAAAVAANLVDLDDNAARKDLDKGPLTGRTAAAWADAKDALSRLWDGYALLTAAITAARTAHDKQRPEFARLVLGSSITLSTTTVPLARLSTGDLEFVNRQASAQQAEVGKTAHSPAMMPILAN